MNAFVLTESSGTNSGEHLEALNHYRGNFLPVKTLIDRLTQHADTDTHIITNSHGLVNGTDVIKNIPEQDHDQALTDATDTLLNHLPNADIVVILTTSDTFHTIIADNWFDIVNAANADSIWCLGSGKTALNECDLDALRNKVGTLHTYQRVGVAPIDNDTQDALLETIESANQQSP